jgi:hypothetical protein
VGSLATSLSWSPNARSRIVDGYFEAHIHLAASFEDNSIILFLNNEIDDLTKYQRKRSLGWINHISFDPSGELIASVGGINRFMR